jgi:hypothetical protein
VAKTTKKTARLTNVSQNQKSKLLEVKPYRRAYGNLRSNSRTLGEINPLGLTKLGSILGSIERVFGLSIAARIASFKVCRQNQESPLLSARGVSIKQAVYGASEFNRLSGHQATLYRLAISPDALAPVERTQLKFGSKRERLGPAPNSYTALRDTVRSLTVWRSVQMARL